MRKVVTNSDLKKALGLKGIFGTCVAGMAYGFLRLGKINRLFDGAADYQGCEFADHLLENMNITIDVAPEQLENIPKIWIATSAENRELAEGVHLRMEIVVQSIAVPTYIDTDGKKKNVWWLQAWSDATGIDKLNPEEARNEKYRVRKDEYTIIYE